MGERGPVPKRSENRIRRNAVPEPDRPEAEGHHPSPFAVDDHWDDLSKEIVHAFERSGQSRYFVETDWIAVHLFAEAVDRELKPQFIGFAESSTPVKDDEGGLLGYETRKTPMQARIPMKGATLSALRAWGAALLMTEGDRRRMLVELQKKEQEETADEGMAAIYDLQNALRRKPGA